MLLLGYFEGLDSERAIAWRAADSLSVRSFLGLELHEAPPDHSPVSRTRRLIDVETHQAVFTWVLQRLAEAKLMKGTTIGIDATTLEANAALRSIVRRDTGESYEAFLTRLAQASGIETPTREDLARLDRKRPKKGSNDDWQHPHDPDAKITKMKDGRTQELLDLEAVGVRSYISEPDRGRRNWKKNPAARDAVHRNRRRIRGARGQRLLRQRGERLERPFAHLYETRRMRRVHLRGHTNLLKRLLIHAGGLNLGLLMRQLFGIGTPRSLQGRAATLLATLWSLRWHPETTETTIWTPFWPSAEPTDLHAPPETRVFTLVLRKAFATGC